MRHLCFVACLIFCHFKLWSWMNLSTRATTGRTDSSQYLKAACGSIRLACPCFTSRSVEPCSYIQFFLHATPQDFPPIHSDFRLTRQQAILTMVTVIIAKISLSPPPFDLQPPPYNASCAAERKFILNKSCSFSSGNGDI